MKSSKVAPIGGKHQSISSLLAEVMADPNVVKCVVITYLQDGDTGSAVYEMTRADLCYAAALIQRMAFEEQT